MNKAGVWGVVRAEQVVWWLWAVRVRGNIDLAPTISQGSALPVLR
jgi:hypothetical protein